MSGLAAAATSPLFDRLCGGASLPSGGGLLDAAGLARSIARGLGPVRKTPPRSPVRAFLAVKPTGLGHWGPDLRGACAGAAPDLLPRAPAGLGPPRKPEGQAALVEPGERLSHHRLHEGEVGDRSCRHRAQVGYAIVQHRQLVSQEGRDSAARAGVEQQAQLARDRSVQPPRIEQSPA